jgi:hypothetical protein
MKRSTTAFALILGLAPVSWGAQDGPMTTVRPGEKPQAGVASTTDLAPAQLAAIDTALKQAQMVILEAEAVGNGVDGGCPPGASMRQYMQDLRAKRLPLSTEELIFGIGSNTSSRPKSDETGPRLDRRLYYVCLALATKSSGPCGDLDVFTQNPGSTPDMHGYGDQCRDEYNRDRVRVGWITGDPDTVKYCREYQPQATDAECRAFQNGLVDRTPLIRYMERTYHESPEDADRAAREMTLVPGVCEELKFSHSQVLCRAMADYRDAYKAKNAAQCKTPVCRALMGQGASACEDYASKFKPLICKHYQADYIAGREKYFNGVLDRVQTFLNESDAGVGNIDELKAFNARLDSLYELRERFYRVFYKLSPLKPGTTKAKT